MSGANQREQEHDAEQSSAKPHEELSSARNRAESSSSRHHEESSASMPRAQVALGSLNITQLGRYRIVREIAAGGMARVYLAVVDGLDKLVALKVIHPNLAQEESFVGMFLDEARISSSIAHRNVCSVFDFGECDGHYFIAMEYLAGQTLREINMRMRALARQEGALRPNYAGYVASIIAEASEGLHAAHETMGLDGQPLDVVHRDVSPHNLFVTYDGNVSVVDFGIARAANRVQHTATGILKGKFSYMAPEQVRQQSEIDRRADIWSLGVCLWECLTQERLFQRATQAQTLMSVLTDPIRTPSQVKPDLPEELDAIVMRALARDLDERYPTARELGRDLLAFCRRSQLAAGPLELELWMSELFADEITRKRQLASFALQRSSEDGGFEGTASSLRAPTHSGARVRPGAGQVAFGVTNTHTPAPSGQALQAAPSPFDPPANALEARPTGASRPSLLRQAAAHARSPLGWAAIVGGIVLALSARELRRGPEPRAQVPADTRSLADSSRTSAPAPVHAADAAPAKQGTVSASKETFPQEESMPTKRPLALPAAGAAPPRSMTLPARLSRARSGANFRQASANAEPHADDMGSTGRTDPLEPSLASVNEARETSHEQEQKVELAPVHTQQPTFVAPAAANPSAAATAPAVMPSRPAPSVVPSKAVLNATPSVSELDVEGSLGNGVITRMLTRSMGLMRDCYMQSARSAGRNDFSPLGVSLVIDETGSVSAASGAAHPLPDFSSCVARSMRRLRSDIKPDVGTVRVRFKVLLRGM